MILLVGTHPEVVLRALRMKKLANDIGDVVGGRAVHPITCVPGGFTQVPTAAALRELRRRLVEVMVPDFLATVETLKALAGPSRGSSGRPSTSPCARTMSTPCTTATSAARTPAACPTASTGG